MYTYGQSFSQTRLQDGPSLTQDEGTRYILMSVAYFRLRELTDPAELALLPLEPA